MSKEKLTFDEVNMRTYVSNFKFIDKVYLGYKNIHNMQCLKCGNISKVSLFQVTKSNYICKFCTSRELNKGVN